MQPGQTINPDNQQTTTTESPTPQSTVTPQIIGETVLQQSAEPSDQMLSDDSFGDVRWSAAEFIAHQKSSGWFLLLGLMVLVVGGVLFWLTRDFIAPVAIVVAATMFGAFAVRQPRVLQYALTDQGVVIDEKLYRYETLRSFTIVDDGPAPSIMIIPMQRFLPPITLFFSLEEADAIIDALSLQLPHEDRLPDAVDRLMARIRF